MIRRLLQLEANEDQRIRRVLAKSGVSFAEYARQALREKLRREKQIDPMADDFAIDGGPVDGAANHDRHLNRGRRSKTRRKR